ncbi:MAG: amidohydrolase family protein, partial [Verrucomicrobiota bacterium]
PFFEQNPRLRAQLTNVYYDTAAGPLLYDPTIFQRVIDLVGPQKVLFGSDFPLRIFPRQQKRADFNTYLRQIQTSLDLPEATLEAILHRNIRDLLALNKD